MLSSDTVWQKVIVNKYGPSLFLAFEGGEEGYYQKYLKSCIRCAFLSKFVHCIVGDSVGTYFWEDKWLVESLLYSLFPRLYHLSDS